MIDCFNMETAYLYGDALAAQFRLRHRVFIERESYDVSTWRGMEYDQFDTPAAQYLVWRDEQGNALGVARLAPTNRSYMLRELWPEMVTAIPLPCSDKVWEGTRFGVEKSLPTEIRKSIVQALVLGYLEFGVSAGIEQIIGVMPKLIWRSVFQSHGVPVQFLGEPKALGGDKCVAGIFPVSQEILDRARAKCGRQTPVIRTLDDNPFRTAA
ncbi:acyl-homoserine-lactone synthase [Telmatospirillum sp. J64-1]|uniref:acyl-homoserine-lactone synthase n=1 Tax=Telmatospirillum sp. J64-1 TaxID=2502183 RepID=UPI00115CE260|nr:acyl-homoserine-lactone synthase [Telmatospirillum sp. J64-1]